MRRSRALPRILHAAAVVAVALGRTAVALGLAAVTLGLPAVAAAQTSGRGPQEVDAGATAVRTRPQAFVQDPVALFDTGARLAADGKLQEAKRIFESLIQLYPSLPEPYINLGVLLAAEKQTEAAAEALERGIFSHPVCVAAFNVSLVEELSPYSLREIENVGQGEAARPAAPLPPAAASPAPPPRRVVGTRPAEPSREEERSVEGTVLAWAEAWSRQDADAFLAFYADSFRPASGAAPAAWRAERRERIRRPRWIEVKVSELELEEAGDGRARARFRQSYRSDRFSDVVRKVLHLEKGEAGWRIHAEEVVEPAGEPMPAEPTPAEPPRAADPPAADSEPGRTEVEVATPEDAESEAREKAAIVAAVTRWADAWSRQDVEEYLAAYSDSFRPNGGLSLAAWRADRRRKLRAPEWIDVAVSELEVVRPAPGRAVATFRQDYASSTLSDTVRKTLRLAREGEVWRIISEASREVSR